MRAQGRQYVEHIQDENMTKPSAPLASKKPQTYESCSLSVSKQLFFTIIINNYIPNIFDKTIT
jgi:hypothetical protein